SVREVFKPQALRIVVSLLPALACVFAEFLGHGSLSTLLPRHLRDSCELDMEDAGWWSGSINSAQYFGVTLGCLMWGHASDRFGAKRMAQLSMTGTIVLFSWTAFARNHMQLLILRFSTGLFSVIVPAVTYIFQVLPVEQ
ncbi:unnamed protein product, partial [Polarella glacialis]